MPNNAAGNVANSQPRKVDVQSLINRKEPNMPKGIKIVKKGSTGLDKNSFLKILLKQLQYQDPLKPKQDKDFIAQMAQFSALEQMKNVATEVKSLKKFQANFLVGKVITGRDFVTGKTVAGQVKSIMYDSTGQVFLRVNGRSVKMDAIVSVENGTPQALRAPQRKAYKPAVQRENRSLNGPKQNVSRETPVNNKLQANEKGSMGVISKMARHGYNAGIAKQDLLGGASTSENMNTLQTRQVSKKYNLFEFLQKPQGALQDIGSQVEMKIESNKKEKGN